MMKRLLLFCSLFFLIALQLSAQNDSIASFDSTQAIAGEETDDSETGDYEMPTVGLPEATPRNVDEKLVTTVGQDKSFGYMKYIDSVLRNRNEMPQENRIKELPKEKPSFSWVKTALWILAVAGLLFLFWQLWISRNSLIATGNKTIAGEEEDKEQLLVENAAQLAAISIRNKEYRLATRYLFADALLRLGNKGILEILSRKTNQEYLKEVTQTNLHKDLARIMLQFEYVWYGGFSPNEQQFQTIHSTFKKFESTWL